MREWIPNGKHRMCAEGDAVFWELLGDIDADEMRSCLELGEDVISRHGRAFLIMNGAKARSITPAARRFQADWALTHDIVNRGGSVVYGTSKLVRAFAVLIIRASQLFARQTPRVDFVDSEADAIDWLHKQRASWGHGTPAPHSPKSERLNALVRR